MVGIYFFFAVITINVKASIMTDGIRTYSLFSSFLLALSAYIFQKSLNRLPYFGAAGLMVIDQYGKDE